MKEVTQLRLDHLEQLRAARQLLEHPGLTARLTNAVGKPIEKGIALLPDRWSALIADATGKSLETALRVALKSIGTAGKATSSNAWHKVIVTATGAGGGAWGFPALMIELPVSTTIMLRSIADVARSEGEDLTLLDAKLACMQVFALGGRLSGDDSAGSVYFAIRAALARSVAEAAEYIAERGMAKEGAPVIVRFISRIATRFGAQVSEKAAAQAVPIVGALGGALINLAFISHFQSMARGHFVIRRLERLYGRESVEREYRQLREEK